MTAQFVFSKLSPVCQCRGLAAQPDANGLDLQNDSSGVTAGEEMTLRSIEPDDAAPAPLSCRARSWYYAETNEARPKRRVNWGFATASIHRSKSRWTFEN